MSAPGTIAGVLCVRDEEELIARNLLYHLEVAGLDRMVVVDNGSTDATVEKVRALADPRITLYQTDPGSGFVQDVMTTELAGRLFREEGVDWVLPVDGDEFWVSDSAAGVRDALARMPDNDGVVFTPSYRFFETELDNPAEPDPLRRLTFAEPESFGSWRHKVVLHRLGDRLKGLPIGNHDAELVGPAPRRVAVPHHHLCRYHYRHTGVEAFRKRMMAKISGYVRRYGPGWLKDPQGRALRFHQWYRLLQEGRFEEAYRRRFVWSEERVRAGLAARKVVQLERIRRLAPAEPHPVTPRERAPSP